MAVKRDSRYPGRWTASDADFPLGGPKNRTTTTSQDGSYFNRDFIADYEAFFQRLMTEAGITANETPDTAPTSQFFEAMKNINSQEYSSAKIYSYGDVVYKTIGGIKKFFRWYSNVESLSGKDPELDSNRRTGWSDTTKPFYWLPYSPKISGETIHWDTDTIPENMIIGMGQQLPVAVYHTLAAAKPEWIDETDNTLINIPDRQGRFTRAADGATWLSGETHEDAIRNITAYLGGDSSTMSYLHAYGPVTQQQLNAVATGAFRVNHVSDRDVDVGGQRGYGASVSLSFNAAHVVPTSSENMPKGYIEWVGYAL